MVSNKVEDCRKAQKTDSHLEVTVDTEDVSMGEHESHFNRDAESGTPVASQGNSRGSVDVGCLKISPYTGTGRTVLPVLYLRYLLPKILFYLIF